MKTVTVRWDKFWYLVLVSVAAYAWVGWPGVVITLLASVTVEKS